MKNNTLYNTIGVIWIQFWEFGKCTKMGEFSKCVRVAVSKAGRKTGQVFNPHNKIFRLVFYILGQYYTKKLISIFLHL